MQVYFVGAGPGDPDLLTVKARRLLENCQICIYAGSLVSPQIIALVDPQADRHDSAGMSLDRIVEVIGQAHEKGIDVIRLHTGDPSIYGAISEQMNRLDEMQIAYEVVPGVSSFQAAAAALKAELTCPEISQTVILTRTSGRTPMPRHQDIETLAKSRSTLCLFLSVHKIGEVAKQLDEYYGADCPVAVVYHASWHDQIVIKGTIKDIEGKVAGSGITKTAMVIVGHALARPDTESKLYDSRFTHGYRKGAEK
ncbi:MAG: precorrin-4 C(11)-methyltransferase [Planctomycetes bacterium]|nr:precorrin-4 C(11)-methyltransferase [Planctomycetota bacterium]